MMELRTVRKVRNGLLSAILILGVLAVVLKSPGLAFSMSLPLIAFAIVDLLAWCCPACGKYLGRDVAEYCTWCGEKPDILRKKDVIL